MLFRTIHDMALMMDRERVGREASPSAGVADSQTVKAPAAGAKRGYDAAKKTVGSKRHVGVDKDGRLLMVKLERKSVAEGQTVGVRVSLGGRRSDNKKKRMNKRQT